MEERSQAVGVHKVSMTRRQGMSLTGVKDVLSFDEEEVCLETTEGMLEIHGEGLHVKNLSVERGEVELEGKIDRFSYSEKTSLRQNGESFLTRLFR